MTRWIVDGMNVIGSRPDGWWRDRQAAQRRLVERLEGFAEAEGSEVTVVFDGRDHEVGAGRGVNARFASRRGANAADDDIAEFVEQDSDPQSLTVVTSDRDLARRVQARGAQTMGAGTFLDLLDGAQASNSRPDSSSNSRRFRSSPPP